MKALADRQGIKVEFDPDWGWVAVFTEAEKKEIEAWRRLTPKQRDAKISREVRDRMKAENAERKGRFRAEKSTKIAAAFREVGVPDITARWPGTEITIDGDVMVFTLHGIDFKITACVYSDRPAYRWRADATMRSEFGVSSSWAGYGDTPSVAVLDVEIIMVAAMRNHMRSLVAAFNSIAGRAAHAGSACNGGEGEAT